jgi:hypothetical protein
MQQSQQTRKSILGLPPVNQGKQLGLLERFKHMYPRGTYVNVHIDGKPSRAVVMSHRYDDEYDCVVIGVAVQITDGDDELRDIKPDQIQRTYMKIQGACAGISIGKDGFIKNWVQLSQKNIPPNIAELMCTQTDESFLTKPFMLEKTEYRTTEKKIVKDVPTFVNISEEKYRRTYILRIDLAHTLRKRNVSDMNRASKNIFQLESNTLKHVVTMAYRVLILRSWWRWRPNIFPQWFRSLFTNHGT